MEGIEKRAIEKADSEIAAAEAVSYTDQKRWMHYFQRAFAVAAASDVVVVEKEEKVAAAAAEHSAGGSVAVLAVRVVGQRRVEGAQRFDHQRLDLSHLDHCTLHVVVHLLAS